MPVAGTDSAPPPRRSGRQKRLPKLPYAMKALFFSRTPRQTQRRSGRALTLKHAEPCIYTIENFLTDSEIKHLDDAYVTPRFQTFMRSYTDDETGTGEKTYSAHRTSTFTWLGKAGDPILRRVEERAADIVGIHRHCVEPFQIVAYRDGQRFGWHHDMGPLDDDTKEVTAGFPRRLATIFVYLNSLPEGQGHTEFPGIGLSVTPKRGMAVLFPNVLENGEPDVRTVHGAKPVGDGHLKVGMNVWLTQSDLQDYIGTEPVKHKLSAGKKRTNGKARKGAAKKRRKTTAAETPDDGEEEGTAGVLEKLRQSYGENRPFFRDPENLKF